MARKIGSEEEYILIFENNLQMLSFLFIHKYSSQIAQMHSEEICSCATLLTEYITSES